MYIFNYFLLATDSIPTIDWLEKLGVPVITSLLASGLLVGIIEFFKWKKDIKIENITHERKQWRDDLRDIALEISQSKGYNKLEYALTKLKVRINTTGIINSETIKNTTNKDDDQFYNDAYLWNLIMEIEELDFNNATNEELRPYKLKLIQAISLLIKHDWDRSKNEIENSVERNYKIIVIALISLIFLITLYPVFALEEDLIFSVIITALLVLLPMLMSFSINKFLKSKITQVIICIISNLILYSILIPFIVVLFNSWNPLFLNSFPLFLLTSMLSLALEIVFFLIISTETKKAKYQETMLEILGIDKSDDKDAKNNSDEKPNPEMNINIKMENGLFKVETTGDLHK